MKKFRKLILSLVLLAATAVTFASTTFAFVFLQMQTEIDEFDIKLELDEGLLISIDGVNFSNSITEEQIKEHIAGSIQAFNKLKYSGVTPKTINNKLAYDKNGEVEFIKIFGDYASIAPNDNYIKFDLWFKPLVEGAVRKNYGVKVSDDSYFAGNLVDVEVANQVLELL